jgi:hypothetical protein
MDVSAADDSTQLSASENSSQYYGQRITAESSLVGAEVNTLSALLIRVADPPGDVTFAVVDEARQVKYRFGSYRAADIPVEPTFIQVANAEASYALQADDRVVVMYTDGDDTHKIRMHATADSFDAQRTHRIRWHVVDGWATGVDVDSSMRMGCTVE